MTSAPLRRSAPLACFICQNSWSASTTFTGKEFSVLPFLIMIVLFSGDWRGHVCTAETKHRKCDRSAVCVRPKPVFKLLMVQLTAQTKFMLHTQLFAVWLCHVRCRSVLRPAHVAHCYISRTCKTHTHIHTHAYIYIYMYTVVYIDVTPTRRTTFNSVYSIRVFVAG